MPDMLQSVTGALRVLKELQDGREKGVSELAHRLDLSVSTTYRLVATLRGAGFVEQDSSRKYRLVRGIGVAPDPSVIIDHHSQVATQHIEWLSEESGETVHISVLKGRVVEFTAVRESTQRVRVISRVGESLPAHATAAGKALLAQLNDDAIRLLFGDESLPRVTARTASSLEALLAELAIVREQGFAVNASESEVGLDSIAVPLNRPHGEVISALTMAGPTSRMNVAGDPLRFIPLLQECARRIEADLRY